jgi:phosphonate transport system permease protein
LAQTGLFSGDVINPRGGRLFERFFRAALTPELSIDFLGVVLEAALQTLTYAVIGIVVTVIIGFIGGLFASEVWWQSLFPNRGGRSRWLYRLPWVAVRAALALPRAIHEILLGLFFLNIFGLHPLTVILAIGLHFGAVTAKVNAEILDETPRDAYHAICNSGVVPLKAFFYTLIPQAFPNLVAYGFYRLECAIRASAILGVVGAGGLGYQIYLSLQSFEFRQVWTLLYALVFLSGFTDVWSGIIRATLNSSGRTTLCVDAVCSPLAGSKVNRAPTSANWVSRYSLPAFGVVLILAIIYVRPDLSILTAERTQRLWGEITGELFPPKINLPSLIESAGQTLAMSILALTIASGIGVIMAFPAARNFTRPVLPNQRNSAIQALLGTATLLVTRTLLLFMRAIPAPVWALILLFVMFPGILPGAVALGIYTGGILGRLMAETTENLDDRPMQALRASGVSGLSVIAYGVFPGAAPQFITYILYRWEVCIRETIIVGLVGAGGLGRLISDQLVAFDYGSIMGTLIGIILLTFSVDILSSFIRRSLR